MRDDVAGLIRLVAQPDTRLLAQVATLVSALDALLNDMQVGTSRDK